MRALGRVKVIAPGGDLVPGDDFQVVKILSGEDQDRAMELASKGTVVVDTADWKVIPLENLVATAPGNIWTVVRSREEMSMALGVLERGVAGVVVEVQEPALLRQLVLMARNRVEDISLEEGEIREVVPLGLGDRVCVDTCSLMGRGQGMLVGNSSTFLFLIHAESVENPYVAPRPFRINAGAVHAYALVPGGRTRYLSELEAGDEVLVVDYQGAGSTAVVGRAKVEKRPLLMVKAQVGDVEGTCILQNAETIRLVAPGGDPLSVVALKPGDRVLVHLEKGARHFGMKVEESIQEK